LTLNGLGLLESLDAVAFGLLCGDFAALLELSRQLSREDYVLEVGESGYPTPNPLCALVAKQQKGVIDLLREFGMTPAARSSLTGSTSATPNTKTEIDPFEELLKRMNAGPPAVESKKKPATRKRVTKKAAKKRKG